MIDDAAIGEVLDGFRDGRGGRRDIEERRRSHREGEAPAAESGGDDEAGSPEAALPRHRRLLREGLEGGRFPVVLERQPGQCDSLFPNSELSLSVGFQLRI